ncbi:MAG: MFS transporter, partial [Gammaproteobacteria bacterium]
MTQPLLRVATLLLAVAILLTGHGLQLTLLPMRADQLGWSTSAIGLTGSAYFLGFVFGCLQIPAIVSTVAHIRTFMVMAAIATIALLGTGVFESVGAWMVLRFGTGFAFSGLYMVIESWISETTPREYRGRVLAVYAMISLLAMVVGQTLLGLSNVGDPRLLFGGAMILALAIIPIGLTRMPAPPAIAQPRFSPRVVAKASRVAVVSVLFGGLVTGGLWAVGPLVGKSLGLEPTGIGLMMSAALTGGALAQFPLGRLSDRTDRRRIIAGLFCLGAFVGLAGSQFADASPRILYLAMFFIGATSFPLYALCIATASDSTDLSMIQITSSILIVNGIGSVLGPIIAAPLVGRYGGAGFFLFAAVCMVLGASWAACRIRHVDRSKQHEHRFQALP